MRVRTGGIYKEETSGGVYRTKSGDLKQRRKVRYSAIIQVNYHRYKFRSTNYENCRFWLDWMLQKYKYV